MNSDQCLNGLSWGADCARPVDVWQTPGQRAVFTVTRDAVSEKSLGHDEFHVQCSQRQKKSQEAM